MNAAAHPLLPPPAPGRAVWRVLDTRFDADRLLALWRAWRAQAHAPTLLHLVVLAPSAPAWADLEAAAAPADAALLEELAPQWKALLPGFQRLGLAGGRLQLTLCLGELQPLLREQQFEADSVWLDPAQPWDRWSLKALARCCRRGTRCVTPVTGTAPADALAQAGFRSGPEGLHYDPPWTLKTGREPLRLDAAPPATCAVIGAGLAGASVAAALARRGWRVQVLDAAPAPAAGASGLPAGLLVPHVSSDDSPRSRLTRAGLRLMWQEAQRLLEAGQDWQPCGVLERRLDGRLGLPADWSAAAATLSAPAPDLAAQPWHAGTAPAPALWHAQAAWIKPARLVQAWLAQPGVQFLGLARVERLQRSGGQWQLLDREDRMLATASQVVLANAGDAPRLLQGLPDIAALPPLQALRGVLTRGLRHPGDETALPPFPVNGLGALIPAVPTDEGLAWYAGATYEAADEVPAPAGEHHRVNLDKLRQLLPAAAQQLAPDFAPGRALGWGSTRCVSADRLPLLGPLDDGTQPTLWLSAAMGSRGLSFAMLCAELLAARLGGEPWPLESSLARFLHARRRAAVQPGAVQAESAP